MRLGNTEKSNCDGTGYDRVWYPASLPSRLSVRTMSTTANTTLGASCHGSGDGVAGQHNFKTRTTVRPFFGNGATPTIDAQD